MYRIKLTDEQRLELDRRAHQRGVAANLRDRLEMLRLSDAGWSVPRIAKHFGQHHQTVRHWIKAFGEGGFDALADRPRGGSVSALTPPLLEALRQEIHKAERTWSAPQIAEWIAEVLGVQRSADQVRRKLRQARLSYKRTNRHLRHKQSAEQVAQKSAALSDLQKGAMPPI